MDLSVINLGSSFDWRESVERILKPLTGEGIADALGIPEAAGAISERLEKLRWVGLVGEEFMEAQTSSSEYGEGKAYTNRWHSNPFEIRMGGSQESSFYMRPRSVTGGGVAESFGIYASNAAEYAPTAFLRSAAYRYVPEGNATLDTILPAEIGADPIILISPERVFELPNELLKALKKGETRPDVDYSETFFRISILHELGHHLFPGNWADDSIHVWEMLADQLCQALLSDYESRWMFARAWLLHPSPYLSFFVPGLLEAADGSSIGRWMAEFLKENLNLRDDGGYVKGQGHSLVDALGTGDLTERLMLSPQMVLAIEGLAKCLGDSEMVKLVESVPPCSIGPLEEFAMPWRTPLAMSGLLQSRDPNLQVAAVDALESLRARGEEIPEVISDLVARWSDEYLLSDQRNVSLRAWTCNEMDRDEGLEERYVKAAGSKHPAIYCDVPRRVRLNLPQDAKRLLEQMMKTGISPDMRHCAAAELALFSAKARDRDGVLGALMNADVVGFKRVWDALEEEGHKLDIWSLIQLLAGDHPFVSGRQYGGDYVKRQEEARAEIRARLFALAAQIVSGLDVTQIPDGFDFTPMAKAIKTDKELSSLVADLLIHVEDVKNCLMMMLEYGNSHGDAAVARVIEAKKVRDEDLLAFAAGKDAILSLRATIANGVETHWLEKAFSEGAANWRVRSAYELLWAGSSEGRGWLSSRYKDFLATTSDAANAAQFLGYLAYMSTINKWSENVDILLESGAQIGIKESSSGNTLLHAAAYAGDVKTVSMLLNRPELVSARNVADRTPLHMVAEAGHTEIVSILVPVSAALMNSGDGSGKTALILAAERGHAEIVRMLLGAGASPKMADKEKKNAVQRAAEAGHGQVAKLILERMSGK